MAIDPSIAAVIGSAIAGTTVWGGTWLVPKLTRKQIKQETAKTKAETDSQIVTTALSLTQALESHAKNLTTQLGEHERKSLNREARYEEKITGLELNWNQEKLRCDGLELKIEGLHKQVLHNQIEIAQLKINPPVGARGIQGVQGEHGIQGEHGVQGEHGIQGIQGVQGEHGQQQSTQEGRLSP